jgi:hypothetical protein
LRWIYITPKRREGWNIKIEGKKKKEKRDSLGGG